MIVEKNTENLKQCKCMHCPSYTMGCKVKNVAENLYKMIDGIEKANHFEGMYCAFEKSSCIHEDKGCICSECPIHDKYKLNKNDYCLG